MRTSLRIFFGAVILALLVYFLTKIDFAEAFRTVKEINPWIFLVAFGVFSLANVLFVARGMISLRKIVNPGFWFFSESTLAGFFINIITPGSQVGGEPVRAYYIAKRYRKPNTKVLGAVLADRVIHAAVSLFFIISSLLFILTYVPVSSGLRTLFQTALFAIFIFLAALFWMNTKKAKISLRNVLQKLGLLQKMRRIKVLRQIWKHFGNFTSSFKKTISDKKTLSLGISISVLHWLMIYFSSYLLFLSVGVYINFFLVIVAVCMGSMIGEFSPTPGGVGFVEGTMVFVYSLIGIDLETAVIVAVLSRMMWYFWSLFVGSLSLLHLEKKLG